MKNLTKAILLMLFANPAYSFFQSNWIRVDTIAVFQNDKQLLNPWAGGLNTFTLKNLDYDFDGDLDLLAYEDANNDLLLWENHKEEYLFKNDFYDFTVNTFIEILDINKDEIPDLITGVDRNLAWYKGFNINDTLQFENLPNNFKHNQSFINTDESPGFADLDNDGDYDFILNDATGQFIELYTNTTEIKDSITYEIEDTCWGEIKYFYVNDSIVFNSDCDRYAKTNSSLTAKHIVPSLILEDLDNDGDEDLILSSGNINYANILYNKATSFNPLFNSSTNLFPSNEPLNIENRPYINRTIVNNSLENSIICTPQYVNFGTEPYNISWLYQKDEDKNYQLITKQFLVDEMLDVGKFSIPTFHDVDNDGLIDLLISNTIPNDSLGVCSQVYFYKNTGSKDIPEFTFIEDDYLNLSSIDDTTLNIEFGDFDNDADDDMIVGGASGQIHYLKNEAQEFIYNGVILFKDSIFQLDFGSNANPAVIDYNKDGLADILVGKSSGKLELITNLGITQNGTPIFEITNNCFGNISTQIQGQLVGHSAPHFSGNLDSLVLHVGSTNGNIYQFNNVNLTNSENLLPDDTLQTKNSLVKPALYNNLQNKQLLVVGNSKGGLTLYSYLSDKILNNNALIETTSEIKIFPNPFSNKIFIQNNQNKEGIIKIYTINAQLVHSKKMQNSNNLIEIKTGNFDLGCYIVQIVLPNSTLHKKIIKHN